MVKTSSNEYIVKPVHKAMSMLQVLIESNRRMTLKELAYNVGISKSTLFRYLQTFIELGYIEYSQETKEYWVGKRLIELGELALSKYTVNNIVKPYMEHLREQFNETVNLGIIDGNQILYTNILKSNRSLWMFADIGNIDNIHSTALGKSILAYVPDDELLDRLRLPLLRVTPNTITSVERLKQDLSKAKEYGYAIDENENEEGVTCIAAPIFENDKNAVAAISISLSSFRWNKMTELKLVDPLLRITQEISAQISH